MSEIRYVCLSDMHLGEEDSLLTNLKTASTDTDPLHPSPVMEQLVECFKYLILVNNNGIKPSLILNGDILELALNNTNEAAMVFERFIELVMKPGEELFDKIIYNAGNHDHHIWELARETQYMDHINTIKTGEFLPIPYHTTSMFENNQVQSYFLTNLANRFPHLKEKNFIITTSYPNYGVLKKEDQKCVIFHHGHFIESLYQLISNLRNLIFADREQPTSIWDIESENFAWIDFFWSTMGRSGEAGKDVELIYEKMHDKAQFDKLISTLVDNIADEYDLPGWDFASAKILKTIINLFAKKVWGLEKSNVDHPLSKNAEKGFYAYMHGPLRKQILTELGGNMPLDMTFVFGHTHKPFQDDMSFKGYPQWVNVYNTGGWVVESVDQQPIHGGAIVLVDDNLDVVSLNMYNENENPEEYSVSVNEASHTGESHHPFYMQINDLVKSSKDPWNSFSEIAARSVHIRKQHLRARINRS